MPRQTKTRPLPAKMVSEFAKLEDEKSRARYLSRHPKICTVAVAQQLNEVVRTMLRADTQRALSLAETAVAIARKARSQEMLGRTLRSKANALYMIGDNQTALDFHAQAIEIFRKIGNSQEEARTLIPSIQPFILLGQYDRAFTAAEHARTILEKLGDKQRLGHLEINVGNIYHRQDRFEEGLACYERAYDTLIPFRDAEGLAVALYNMSVCLITLNDFPRALASYERAREMCVQNGMALLVTQADYNIAYLYYLRGEYGRAIEMLRATRKKCEENGDAHVLALCYLDLSEIYLELNLSMEAQEVAHEGYLRFQKLGMGYEEAKCQANEAMALSQIGKALRAIELFDQARVKFVREKNLVWPWLIDLYHALVLFNEGRFFEARRYCKRAATFFETSLLPGKAVLCQLLLARLSRETGDYSAARAECEKALSRLASLDTPALQYQAECLMGQLRHAGGDREGAYQSYQKAREALETLRSALRGEELKIAFMKNRLEVYESLADLCLQDNSNPRAAEESFGYMEMAKSRTLAELLVHHAQALPIADSGQSGLVRRIREMREELNWYYRRLEHEQLRTAEPSQQRIEALQKKALAHENELIRTLREVPTSDAPAFALSADQVLPSIEKIRSCIPSETTLVEYFSIKDEFVAAVLTRDRLEIVPLTPISTVMNQIRMLHFQISKFHLGEKYVQEFERPLLNAAQSHLAALHRELIAPLRNLFGSDHLVVVPHGALHYLPFHALFDGERYLIDVCAVSYAPSATVFTFCQQKKASGSGPPLVLGIPDEQAPLIANEAREVADVLPGAELFLKAEASQAVLRTKGQKSRIIHVATHGTFRQDNPMFSGIRLGDGYLSLYDLYQLRLTAELVTLSGCATGLNVVSAGDELLGLIRGLFYAGAESLLLTLWNVNDRSTVEFMRHFYGHYSHNHNKSLALRLAMQDLRDRYPHPYYWAPFILAGKISSRQAPQE